MNQPIAQQPTPTDHDVPPLNLNSALLRCYESMGNSGWIGTEHPCKKGLDLIFKGSGFLNTVEFGYLVLEPQDAKKNLQNALIAFNDALQILQKVENQDLATIALQGKARTLVKMGDVYMNGVEAALQSYKEALSILREKAVRQAFPKENRSEEANTLRKIAEVHAVRGQWEESIQDYNQALLLFQENGDRRSEAITLNNLGQIYADLGQRDKALNYYEQALPLSRVGGDRTVEAAILSNRGMLYANKQDANKQEWQEALKSLNQALTLLRDGKDRSNRGDILNKIGLVYCRLNENLIAHSKPRSCFRLARDISPGSCKAASASKLSISSSNTSRVDSRSIWYLNSKYCKK